MEDVNMVLSYLTYSSEEIKNVANLLTTLAKEMINSISGKNLKEIGNTVKE